MSKGYVINVAVAPANDPAMKRLPGGRNLQIIHLIKNFPKY